MPAKIFISYSHQDDALRKRFEVALAQLKRTGSVASWSDRKIIAGENWENAIDQNLESADIIICLVSPDFLASDYCYGKELSRALEMHAENIAKVVPVILRPCEWKESPLSALQALPTEANPISKWQDSDDAWLDVSTGIRTLITAVPQPKPLQPIRHQIALHSGFVTPETLTWLNDTEVEFLHRHAGRVELPDVFVCPDLKRVRIDVDAKRSTSTTSCDEVIRSDGFTLILGDEQSGKTSLAKHYYRSLLERGWYPVFLNGGEINNSDVAESTRKAIKHQYQVAHWPDIEASDKKVIIIDDYSELKLNRKYQNKFNEAICDSYQLVILFAIDTYKYVVPEISTLSNFHQYEVLPFGNVKRAALIEKWVSIGVAEQIDENDFYESSDSLKIHIDSLVNRNIVPAKPLYLLTILQTFETVKPSRIELTSYGHCYQYLIQKSLESVNIKHTEVDSYLNVLTEFARAVFENGGDGLEEVQLSDFINSYHQKYLTVDQKRVFGDLKKCKILCDLQGKWNFKYRYIYYFYAAKNLAEQLSKSESSKTVIRQLLKFLHREDCANIIIFITHHTKDQWILDEVRLCMMELFQEQRETRLESKELLFLAEFIANIPMLVIEQREIEGERKKANETKDAAEDARREFDRSTERLEPTDVLAKVNRLFRGIELIGQVVRNRYGSLERDALRAIVEDAFSAGLRFLGYFLQLSDASKEHVISTIATMLKENPRVDNEIIEKHARSVFLMMTYSVISAVVRKVASSIGSKEAEEIFLEIEKTNGSPAIKLIVQAIDQQFHKRLQEKKLHKLSIEFKKNVICNRILQEILIQHIYMHPVSYKEKQMIAQMFDIPLAAQQVLIHQKKLNLKGK